MDFRKILDKFGSFDSLDSKLYRTSILVLVGIIVLMAASGLVAFSLVLRGGEQTLVPDVKNMELTVALQKLQEKELYPRISLKTTNDPATKGRVIEQHPFAGAIVKAGRRISIVVSKGGALDRVGSYIGQNLDDVKMSLQAMFTSTRPLLTVREPPVFVFNKSPALTILEQSPGPDTELTGPVELVLVVSRGPEKTRIKVPDLMGLSLSDAILQIEKSGAAFAFTTRNAEGGEKPGTVVSQLPAPGSLVDDITPVACIFSNSLPKEGMVSGLFTKTLPEYPYPLKLSLFVEPPDGQRMPLITTQHPGKEFSLPYTVPSGSVLVLEVLNKVIARVEAKGD